METALVSFGIVFVAELGDKSQLMAMMLATRYRSATVLAAIAAATAAMQLISVTVGAVLDAAIPPRVTAVLAGLAFMYFAVATLRDLPENDGVDDVPRRAARSAFWAVAGAFFLAEIGDKTMLATVTLAATGEVFATWIGATLGMVASSAIGVFVGQLLTSRLPDRPVRYLGATLFAVTGLVLLVNAAR